MKLFLPVIRQAEEAECGLACIAMVVNYYGHKTDLTALRRDYRASSRGMSIANLISVAHRLHLASRALRIEPHDIGDLRLPCILHLDCSHFVVVRSVKGSSVLIHDPAHGKRWVPFNELNERFTGVALELWPTEAFTPVDISRPVTIRELLGNTKELRLLFGKAAAYAALTEGFALLSPLFLQRIVDRVILQRHGSLTLAVVGLALFGICETFASTAKGFATLDLGNQLRLSWDLRLLTHLIRLPVPYFEKRSTGDVLMRFDASETVRHTITDSFVDTCLSGLVSAVTLVAMLAYSPSITLIVLTGAILYLSFRQAVLTLLRDARRVQASSDAYLRSHFIETLTGIRALKLFQQEERRVANWFNLLVNAINARSRTEKMTVWARTFATFTLRFETIAVFAVATLFVLHHRMTLGGFFAFIAYQASFNIKVFSLIDKTYDIRILDVHLALLADIVREAPEPIKIAGQVLGEVSIPASVELRSVSFRYSEYDPWIFRDLTLKIRAGECVAIVGRSGAGKSTLLKVICGLAVPSSGQVLIDVAPTEGDVGHSNPSIGVVLQDDNLFSGTIAQNIHFFSDAPDMDRVRQCACYAALERDISFMPMGYDTQVGTGGSAVSGGQRQRLLIARALYGRPSLLIFDESTSHLDLVTERAIADTLHSLAVTRIMVAHRPETIAIADRVLGFEQDAFVEITPDFRENSRKAEHSLCS